MATDIPNRKLSAAESHARQDDLDQAIKLFKSIHDRLETVTPIIESIILDAGRFRQMVERNSVLRAAMVSRRLSIRIVTQDMIGVRTKISSISKFVGKTLHAKASELEETVLDPELLR